MNTLIISTFSCTFEEFKNDVTTLFLEEMCKEFVTDYEFVKVNEHKSHLLMNCTDLEKLGAEVVNMTLGPESRLISELSIPHVSLVCSSNWAAGRNPRGSEIPINHEEVTNVSSSMENIIIDCINSLVNNYST